MSLRSQAIVLMVTKSAQLSRCSGDSASAHFPSLLNHASGHTFTLVMYVTKQAAQEDDREPENRVRWSRQQHSALLAALRQRGAH